MKRGKATSSVPSLDAPTYGILPNGRQSLRANMFGEGERTSFKSNWLQDPSTYPIIGIMMGAMTMLTIAASNTMLNEPDVCISKSHRSQMIRDNYEEGHNWEHSGLKKYLVGKDSSHNSLFHPLRTIKNDKQWMDDKHL